MRWTKLTRAEKLSQLFVKDEELSLEERAQELWGYDARTSGETIVFPVNAPWNEIVSIIKQTSRPHRVHVWLSSADFADVTDEGLLREGEDNISSFIKWRDWAIDDNRPSELECCLYDENLIVIIYKV